MAYCTKCGSAISEGASFCSACGTPVSSIVSSSAMLPQYAGAAGAGVASNVAATLSYLGFIITAIVFLVVEPYKRDAFVRFHAFQSICYTAVIVVFGVIWGSITSMAYLWSGFLWAMVGLVSILINLAFFCYWIFLMYKAYNKERYMIPFIGDFAFKQAGREG